MPDDIFRIVITVAVGLASLAFLVQAAVIIAFYRSARKMQAKVTPLVDRADPVIDKLEPLVSRLSELLEKAIPAVERMAPMADKATMLLVSANHVVEENRPKITALLK